MKKYFIAIHLLLIICTAFAQKQRGGWKYNHLKGKVSTIETKYYDKDNKAGRTEKQFFDSSGTLLSATSELITDELWFVTEEKYEYDEKGNLVYRVSTDYNQNSKERNDDSTVWVYNYDDKGNRIGMEAGELSWEDTYDKTGNLVQSLYLKNRRVVEKTTITRDSKNNTSEEKIFDAAGELLSTETAKYNARKNYTERSKYDADGKLTNRYTYAYNKNDEVVSFVTTTPNGSNKITYTYVYDNMQNWTVKIQFKDGVKQSIEKRDIKYY